ncbi:UDP-N-acetylmuramoyl-L-alanyl-D-glutamate--2,6-diaminopimelate ligase [Oceanospirillum beijerinckii]|uniref:UDP-N-acetylmuramoyl-L-alanyl-D-glutamate--2, 6-diaminopimelate ligase n=1 Tax=Oceanospirillum beijerinckii TaxID=64976 RepID=UPI000414321B|nr:UDP-N-acetylmuramoyl-L-alanyl-D-glutamate--2,6-diaminopimelate ligase [Oceanospirillum beijerinckii]
MPDRYLRSICSALQALFPHFFCPDNLSGQLRLDSRQVQSGDLFIALQGSQLDGRRFIPAAIEQGAALVLVESDQDLCSFEPAVGDDGLVNNKQAVVVELTDLRRRLGQWLFEASNINDPRFTLIGVTGTNGKTSVSHYLAQLLESLHKQTAVIGTVGIGALDSLKTATHTTPDLISLHQTLDQLFQQGFYHQAMEVSSHALDQQRTAGVPFTAAAFTNLSRDHLDYHGSMQAYGEAKLKLFQQPGLPLAVVNLDDAFAEQIMLKHSAEQCLTYSLSNSAADLYCQQITATTEGFQLQLAGRWGEHQLDLPLLGQFNIANVLSALLTLLGLGFDLQALYQSVSQLKPVPGRMQLVTTAQAEDRKVDQAQDSGLLQAPKVVVDYAHTPDALDNALRAVREHLQGRLWCVFGCGGDRDRGKRPLMAQAAEKLADCVVVTSDNPRTEDPQQIIADTCRGLSNPAVLVEVDRQRAIQQTLLLANADDVVLLAGKGHEAYQEIDTERFDFDDVEQAKQAQRLYLEQAQKNNSQGEAK